MPKKLIGKKYNIDEENISFRIGRNASLTYDISGKSRNCRIGVDNYGVGKLYTSFVYKFKPGKYIPRSILNGKNIRAILKEKGIDDKIRAYYYLWDGPKQPNKQTKKDRRLPSIMI